jgi:hypothetical protein
VVQPRAGVFQLVGGHAVGRCARARAGCRAHRRARARAGAGLPPAAGRARPRGCRSSGAAWFRRRARRRPVPRAGVRPVRRGVPAGDRGGGGIRRRAQAVAPKRSKILASFSSSVCAVKGLMM